MSFMIGNQLRTFPKLGENNMAKCIVCGSNAKEIRIDLDYCKTCAINFDNRIQNINDATDNNSLESSYSKAINAIETKDNYNQENKDIVISHFKSIYDEKKEKLRIEEEKKISQGLIYAIKGVRGRNLEVYKNKIVLRTNLSLGSVITGNMTDGKKTIYYRDVIGLQFKPAGMLIGYLQLETASPIMNNEKSNFFNENTFTFDESTTTNIKMEEVEEYIDKRLEEIKTNNY